LGNRLGKGRPKGRRNNATLFQEALEKDGLAIIRKIKLLALKADRMAMKLCMERLIPISKTPNSRFRLPGVETAAGLALAIAAVTRAVSRGRLSAKEGEAVAKIIESQRRILEAEEFDARLRALEGSK
jgi:hypothetical protein